ncbi:MAG: hypothetical protein AB7P76_12395 [Candidatus Melainabacteria bacterium]
MLPPDAEPPIDAIDLSDLGMISDENADAVLARMAAPVSVKAPPGAAAQSNAAENIEDGSWVITGEEAEKPTPVPPKAPPSELPDARRNSAAEHPAAASAEPEGKPVEMPEPPVPAPSANEVKPANRFALPKPPADKTTARTPRDVEARVIYHQPIQDNQVLTQAMRLPTDKARQVTDFAYDPESDALVSKANFKLAGIKHETSPALFRLLRWFRSWLPSKNPLRLSIDRRATVRLGTRFAWRPAIRWKNSHNKPVRYYQLVRLPSGVVVQVQSQKVLGKLAGDDLKDKEGRHAAKEEMLAMIQQVEHEGYTLQNDQAGLSGKPGL